MLIFKGENSIVRFFFFFVWKKFKSKVKIKLFKIIFN